MYANLMTQDTGHWTQNTQRWTQDTGHRKLKKRHRTLDTGHWTQPQKNYKLKFYNVRKKLDQCN